MKAKIQKWGTGLAVRIPADYAVHLGLHKDAEVEISVIQGKLVIALSTHNRQTLNQRLAKKPVDEAGER